MNTAPRKHSKSKIKATKVTQNSQQKYKLQNQVRAKLNSAHIAQKVIRNYDELQENSFSSDYMSNNGQNDRIDQNSKFSQNTKTSLKDLKFSKASDLHALVLAKGKTESQVCNGFKLDLDLTQPKPSLEISAFENQIDKNSCQKPEEVQPECPKPQLVEAQLAEGCHFDVFYRNLGEPQDSSDKKSSIWSDDHQGLVRNKSLNQTPPKKGFQQDIDLSEGHQSPKESQRIGYAKEIMSPRTPEQLQSGSMLQKNHELLIQSKSINESGGDRVEKSKGFMFNLNLIQDESSESQELQLGQDVVNCPGESRFNYNCQNDQKFQEIQQFEGADKNDENDASSSIFSQTPFDSPDKTQKAAQKGEHDLMLQQIANTINDLDLDSDNEETNSNSMARAQPATQNAEQVVSQKFNAMTLFAYNAEDQDDHLASAFSQSRLFQWQNKLSKDDCQVKAQVDASSIGSGLLESRNIWQMPNLPETCSDGDMVSQKSESGAHQSAQSKKSSDSSNGASLTEEIFANIANGFDLDEEDNEDKHLAIPSSLDSSGVSSSNAEAQNAPQQCKQEKRATIQEMIASLSQQEQQVLYNLDFDCFDQGGCRMLQQMIQTAMNGTNQDGECAFLQCLVQCMLPIIPAVMDNQFGNYLCQKIIEVADPQTINLIVNRIIGNIVEISLNLHGTRAIQTLVDRLALRIVEDHKNGVTNQGINHCTLSQVIHALNQSVVELTMDMHGNHVIQSFLMIFKASNRPADQDLDGSELSSQYTQFIFDACMQNCIQIGKHKHGCCVMQRCLEKGTRTQKLELANHIIHNIEYLIEDPYGNYLVQNVLKLEDEEKNGLIIQQIARDFIRLSQLKFSSNVIEVCLESKYATSRNSSEAHIDKIFKGDFPEDDQQIVKELGDKTKKSKNLKARVHFIVQKLIYNQFGNYVLQKALLIISDDNLKKEILYTIKSLSPSLMQLKHGQKVLQKLQKSYPAIFNTSSEVNSFDQQSQYSNGSSFSQNSTSHSSYGVKYQNKEKQMSFKPQGANSQSFKPSYQPQTKFGAQPFQQNFSFQNQYNQMPVQTQQFGYVQQYNGSHQNNQQQNSLKLQAQPFKPVSNNAQPFYKPQQMNFMSNNQNQMPVPMNQGFQQNGYQNQVWQNQY